MSPVKEEIGEFVLELPEQGNMIGIGEHLGCERIDLVFLQHNGEPLAYVSVSPEEALIVGKKVIDIANGMINRRH